MTTATAIRVSLELACGGSQECSELAFPLLRQLDSGRYDECSVLELPATLEGYLAEHRTARKRRARALRRGYYCAPLARENWPDAIYRINTSASSRQGRPMSPGYRTRPEFSPLPNYRCSRHAIRPTGIWSSSGELVGYLVMVRAGDLALVSQILGHADHLASEIMFALVVAAIERELGTGPGVVIYNRHDSGTDGLRFFKERLGFEEAAVEWAP